MFLLKVKGRCSCCKITLQNALTCLNEKYCSKWGSVRKMRIYNVKLFFCKQKPCFPNAKQKKQGELIISLARITRWIHHVHVIYIFQGKQYSPQPLHGAGNLGLKRVAVFLWQCSSIDVDVCDTKIPPNCKYLYPL